MSSAIRTTIPLREDKHYRGQNFKTQDEQVSRLRFTASQRAEAIGLGQIDQTIIRIKFKI